MTQKKTLRKGGQSVISFESSSVAPLLENSIELPGNSTLYISVSFLETSFNKLIFKREKSLF